MRLMVWSVLAILATFLGSAAADTLRVPGSFATIQTAIDAAVAGDTICVDAGTYDENLDFAGKDVHVVSVSGPEVTILDGGHRDSVVRFVSGEGAGAILEGFTVRNGLAVDDGTFTYGGGVRMIGSDAVVRGNVIRDCVATIGAGIACDGGSPTIVGNRIVGNSAGVRAGVSLYATSATLAENDIVGNYGCDVGGLWVGGAGEVEIVSNRIADNTYGGLFCLGVDNRLDGPGVVHVRRNDFSNRVLAAHVQIGRVGAGSSIVECRFRDASISMIDAEGVLVGRNRFEAVDSFGVIDVRRSIVEIRDNVIRDASVDEGAIRIRDGSDAILVGNQVFATTLRNAQPRTVGAVVVAAGATARLVHESIVSTFSFGEGNAPGVLVLGTATLDNCILWNNDAAVDVVVEGSGHAVVNHCIVEGGWSGEGVGNATHDPRFVDLPSGDLHLGFDSPAIDKGALLDDLPATDYEGDPRVVNGDGRDGAAPDLGADEMLPEIAARYGTTKGVPPANRFDALLVNGSAGNHRRVVRLGMDEPFSVDVLAPPAGPAQARFAAYVWLGEPTRDTITLQPLGLGVSGFPLPIQSGRKPQPRVIWNNLGYRNALGFETRPSVPAPTRFLDRPAGIGVATVVTLQAVLEEIGGSGGNSVSLTNAVVIDVVSGS